MGNFLMFLMPSLFTCIILHVLFTMYYFFLSATQNQFNQCRIICMMELQLAMNMKTCDYLIGYIQNLIKIKFEKLNLVLNLELFI